MTHEAITRWLLIPMFLSTFLFSAEAQDAVDKVRFHYQILASEGLEKLHQREIAELEEVRDAALSDKDLELANKANAKIEEAKLAIAKLQTTRSESVPVDAEFPKNEFYRMVSCNNKLGTELGKEIICRFEKLPLNEFAGDKLVLTIICNPARQAETANEVFVRNGAGGEEIGKVKGMRRGAESEIALSVSPAELLELAILVKGGDAVHLKPFNEAIPEMYLSIRK